MGHEIVKGFALQDGNGTSPFVLLVRFGQQHGPFHGNRRDGAVNAFFPQLADTVRTSPDTFHEFLFFQSCCHVNSLLSNRR